MAIQLGTIIVGKQIDGTKCTIKTLSEDVDKPTHIDIDLTKVVKPVDSPKWSNYVTGVLALYLDKIKPKQKHAFQLCIGNNVPVGGGLSSSASIEVAMCTFLECLYQQELDKLEKALLCQKAEQTFANVPCGIMDQYVACKGEKDHAVLIDCRTNTSKLIPMKDQDVAILVSNTNVKHELGVGTFGERVQQCEEAAKILGMLTVKCIYIPMSLLQLQYLGKKRLRDVESLDELKKLHGKMPDVSYRRAYHVVTEIDRTKKGAEALADNNYELFGKYMLESHKSLKDDYEVSCEELDQFVEILKDIDGVYGTRMTGAGFGM
ncbi:unnamed protein product [Didymodactylos carnosus]|uniref:Galactokinase n=1 Tax=Didymodactylos carnosus TaxID=1234261 RepID=A0A8S2ESS2_9BILA|nr:unnamed protein product [Didymodactylos carnosus]CAF4057683.1 unnamed protein product [Didymodactylos carnosus]